MGAYLMAIDVGTTGANAMLFDAEGKAFGSAYREYPLIYPEEHHVEQDAALLGGSAFEVCREALLQSQVDPLKVLAVSVSSQRATFGLLDGSGNVIGGRFYGWQDNRALSVLPEIAARIDPGELYQLTGMPLTPTYSLEKLVWLEKHQPGLYAQASKVVFPADYILFQFGAERMFTEVTCACCSGLIDVRKLEWSERVLTALELDPGKFLPLVTPGTVVGKVSREASRKSGLAEGTLLVCSTGDQQAAAIGAAVIDEGRASLTLGTAGLLVAGTRQLELSKSPGLMAVSSGRVGLYELEGIQLGAASCYRWIRDTFFDAAVTGIAKSDWPENLYHRMERLLNASRPGANGIVFLPYLAGGGYPLWDPLASGMFAGLRFAHTAADLMRAVVEGVVLESYDMYQHMKTAGVTISSLAVTGGATESTVWKQTIAGVFGMEILPLQVPNATLIGSAIFAGIGAGVFQDVEEGVARTVHFAEPVRPDPAQVEVLQQRYESYKQLGSRASLERRTGTQQGD